MIKIPRRPGGFKILPAPKGTVISMPKGGGSAEGGQGGSRRQPGPTPLNARIKIRIPVIVLGSGVAKVNSQGPRAKHMGEGEEGGATRRRRRRKRRGKRKGKRRGKHQPWSNKSHQGPKHKSKTGEKGRPKAKGGSFKKAKKPAPPKGAKKSKGKGPGLKKKVPQSTTPAGAASRPLGEGRKRSANSKKAARFLRKMARITGPPSHGARRGWAGTTRRGRRQGGRGRSPSPLEEWVQLAFRAKFRHDVVERIWNR